MQLKLNWASIPSVAVTAVKRELLAQNVHAHAVTYSEVKE